MLLSGPQGVGVQGLVDLFRLCVIGDIKKWRKAQGAGLKV